MSTNFADDRAVRDLLAGGLAFPAILVAHEIGLFESLARGPRSTDEVAAATGLPPRSADALLTLATAAGLLESERGAYALRPLARTCFLRGSETTLAGYLDLLVATSDRTSYAGMRRALRTGEPAGDGLYEEDRTRLLERGMHDRGVLAARAWVRQVDLDRSRRLLDVGGGSGVHAMEAVRRFPRLHATVLDAAPVCALAARRIEAAGLADRIVTHAADYLDAASFPEADVHLYSEVLHNRSPEDARRLLAKSLTSLPPGGRLLVHEMLLDGDGAGPLGVAAAHLNMLLWTRAGGQWTRGRLLALLTEVGFSGLEVVETGCGYFSLVTGTRPA